MRRLFLFLLCALAALAQAPDITTSGTFTGTGSSTPIFVALPSGSSGIAAWRLTYHVDGFSITAAQVAIQGANALNASSCVAASFSTITTSGSSFVEVVNPSASGAQGNVAVQTYYPCIRVTVTAVTGSGGTVSYSLNGWKNHFNFPISVSVTPSGTQDVNLIKVAGTNVVTGGVAGSQGVGGLAAAGAAAAGNPLQVGGVDSAGNAQTLATDIKGDLVSMCNNPATAAQVFSTLTTSGAQRIITGTTGQKIRVCHLILSTATPEDFVVSQGTGADCSGGATANLTGLYSITAAALDFLGSFTQTATGQDLCVNPSASQNVRVTIVYVKW